MRKKVSLTALFLAALAVCAFAAQQPVKGSSLPDFTISARSGAERSYLGVGSGPFRVSDIKSSLVVIEIFSMYCPYCQAEAPKVNRLFSKIESNPALKGKIKLLGIGVGNSDYEVGVFKKKYNVTFPLFSDGDFKLYKLLGEPRTPYFIGVRINPDGSHRIFYSKLGAFEGVDAFLDQIVKLSGLK